uniref:BRCT domain-containing protein n=1 Tax=Phytophthora ramorum TaxID=164328 RepID=H3H4J8_PHYRM
MVVSVSVSLSTEARTSRGTTRRSPRAAASSAAASSGPQRRRHSSGGPLKGVVAMVDVRVGADAQIDCSDVVARKLRELGASTVKRLTPKLTHLVLSHFTPVWKTKIAKWQTGGGSMAAAATRYELKIVSQLWVNACYVSKKRMDERPFFPVSQQSVEENARNIGKPKLKRRQSLGAEASKAMDAGTEKQAPKTAEKKAKPKAKAATAAPSTPPPTSNFKINKALTGGRRKRRALSMEPMTSDAILKMLGTTEPALEPAQLSTPKQPIRSKSVTSSAKRRKTLNGPPTQQDEDEVTASQASGIVAESESENEKEDEIKTAAREMIEIMDSQASQASPSPLESAVAESGSISTPAGSGGFNIGTPDDGSSTKEPTARDLRRRNRNSLSFCTDCQATRGSAKSPGADSLVTASPETAATVSGSPTTPATPTATASARTTPKVKRISLASASVSKDVRLKKPAVKKAQRKLPTTTDPSSGMKAQRKLSTTTDPSSAMKLTQSADKKRARPLVSNSSLTTPVVKKARRDNKENTVDAKYTATPGSVSMFPRKYRDVNSTPIAAIPMAMSFSSTTSRKTPRKTPRNVIGITGVSSEARGVLQCAIHAIDANMANESGQRKARVIRSSDYSSGVTHLIVGKETRRTIKVLFAIARGAWIVTEDWAFSSLEQERWLPEEDFEVEMFANKSSREHSESRQIFKGMKFFVGPNVEPSREILHSLIQVAGGEICNQISVADICICGDSSVFRRAQRTGIRVVTSKWVFDSIGTMKLEDDAKYGYMDPIGTPAKTPRKASRAAGLEAHSTVAE